MKYYLYLLLLLSCGACSSIGTMHTARPIAQDTTEFSFFVETMVNTNSPHSELGEDEAGIEDYRSFDDTLYPQSDELDPVAPGTTLQLRHGFTGNFDAGLKLYSMGIDIDFNFLLFEAGHLAVAIDPQLQFFPWFGNQGREQNGDGDDIRFTTKVGILWLPLLLDVYHTKRVTMTIGAKGGLLLGLKKVVDNETGDKHIQDVGIAWLAGASVGWKVRQSEKWRILPEIAAMYDFDNNAAHFAIIIGWARVFR